MCINRSDFHYLSRKDKLLRKEGKKLIYLKLFFIFMKIGAFTFGGGYAMLPLIQAEAAAQGWLTETALINFIAVSESTPGPFAVNLSTYAGMETAGILGALCATLGIIFPSFVMLLLIAKYYEKFQNNRIVNGCMSGLKPAVIGLIAAAVASTGKTVLFPEGLSSSALTSFSFISPLLIFTVMLLLLSKKIHPVMIILLSGIAGIVMGYS